jgi:uncharacterized protein with PIN domain
MDEDPLFCEDCSTELSHDDVETVEPVPQLDPESYRMKEQTAEVYECSGCGTVIGFDLRS